MTKYHKLDRVNVIAWAKEMLGSEACQNLSDTKPFKGRGTTQELRQLVSEVDTLETEMAELAAVTKKVPGAAIYLAVHRRFADGYMALRWRSLSTRKHVSWGDAHAYFSSMPSDVRNWYGQANEQAQNLSAKHLELRKLTRSLKGYVQRREPQLFAKQIPGRVNSEIWS